MYLLLLIFEGKCESPCEFDETQFYSTMLRYRDTTQIYIFEMEVVVGSDFIKTANLN